VIDELRRRHQKAAAEQIADTRRRIGVGRQHIQQAEEDGRDTRPLIKQMSQLEATLSNLERDYEVPIFVMTALQDLFIGLEPRVPKDSLLRIRMPGLVDLTIDLAGVPF
jgi:hypothetical protein